MFLSVSHYSPEVRDPSLVFSNLKVLVHFEIEPMGQPLAPWVIMSLNSNCQCHDKGNWPSVCCFQRPNHQQDSSSPAGLSSGQSHSCRQCNAGTETEPPLGRSLLQAWKQGSCPLDCGHWNPIWSVVPLQSWTVIKIPWEDEAPQVQYGRYRMFSV